MQQNKRVSIFCCHKMGEANSGSWGSPVALSSDEHFSHWSMKQASSRSNCNLRRRRCSGVTSSRPGLRGLRCI